MTTDLERRLRQTLEDDASRAPLVERAPEGLRRGVRRRQVRSVAVGAAALVAVVAVAFAGLQLMNGDDRFTPTPAEQHERPVFDRTATIEGFTVTSPSDWSLVDYWPVMGRADEITQGVQGGLSVPGSEWYPGAAGLPVLQLTNYDPGLGAPVCGSPTGDNPFPADGVGLYVGFAGTYISPTDRGGNELGPDTEPWPNTVSVEPTSCEGGTELRFGVRRGDRLLPYLLWYGAGPDASDEARAQLDAIVASFGVTVDQPELGLPGVDSPGFVLWGGTSDDGSTWTIEARPSDQNIHLALITKETDGTYSEGGFADFTVPPNDVEGNAMGVVSEDAERVEFRPADGSPPAVAQLTDLPPSLGYDADAYYFASGYPTKDDAFDGELVAVTSSAGSPSARVTLTPGGVVVDSAVLGEGKHPDAGPWTLEVTLVDRGEGQGPVPELGFMLERHGGGSGSIQPLQQDVFGSVQNGWNGWTRGEGSPLPLDIAGVVTAAAARVVFEPGSDGDPIEAQLFTIPDRFIGPAQAFLVLVEDPTTREPRGDLVVYSAEGQELGRMSLGPTREPGGVTPEIDAVISDLRAVRDALPAQPGFASLDADALAAEAGVDVALGSDPQAGTVSIVVEDDQHAVLLAELPDGQILCIGAERAWSFRYGVGAATTYQACSGGWDGYMLPPEG